MSVAMDADRRGLTPISTGLTASLHVLVLALSAVVLLSALEDPPARFAAVATTLLIFLTTYAVGIRPAGALPAPGPRGWWWVATLTLEWVMLLWLSVEATYVVFALFFLYMRVSSTLWGIVLVAASTAVAVVAFGLHREFDLPALVGPILGAAVAVTISVGYEALNREAHQRQRLIDELTRTRHQLATAERAAGVADERSRLAREIHDTVSQSLSSIIMLLHAARRSGIGSAGGDLRLEQAREAAEEALTETRGFIQELTPPALRTGGIADALARLAHQTEATTGLIVELTVPQSPDSLPTPVEAGLLRIAQSAIANVVQHARATRVDMTLTRLDNEIILDVVDNGDGFDLERLTREGERPSFGLVAMKERVEALGGTLVVESSRGRGTSVVASFTVTP